jgi:hypothetical protein
MSRFKVALVGLRRDYTNSAAVARLVHAVGILVKLLQKQRGVVSVNYLASVSRHVNMDLADALAHLGEFYITPIDQVDFALALPGWEETPETCHEIAVMNAKGVPVFSDLPSLILAMAGYQPGLANVARVRTAYGLCELRSFSRDSADPLLADLFGR